MNLLDHKPRVADQNNNKNKYQKKSAERATEHKKYLLALAVNTAAKTINRDKDFQGSFPELREVVVPAVH